MTVEQCQIPLYTYGLDSKVGDTTLFVGGYTLGSGDTPLYVYGISSASGDIYLHVGGTVTTSGNIDLYLGGHGSAYDSGILYVNGSGIILESGGIPLIVNGALLREPMVCPTLDPSVAIQIPDSLIAIYQDNIDALINQLGKNTILFFEPSRSECPNCLYDVYRKQSTGVYKTGGPTPFARGMKCPYCKGHGLLETESQKCIKCLTKWRPREIVNYGIAIEDIDNIVRLKTYLIHMDDLMRAEHATVSHDSSDVVKIRVRRIINPFPVGLREDRYCISFWELS